MRKGPGGSWYVETDLNGDDEWPALRRYRNWLTEAPYNPGCLPRFLEYVNSPDFRINEVSRTTDGGVDLAKVVFEYVPKDPKKPRLLGWLRLDLARSWVIRDYEFDVRLAGLQDGAKAETTIRNKGFVKYRQENGRQIPTAIEVTKYAKNGNSVTDHINISKYFFVSIPPEEFTLSAFGLGDYELTLSQVQTRTTYRTVTLALGAFLAALVLFRMGRSIQKGRKGTKTRSIRGEPVR
ncbi:MAG: hypothetical protein ACHRXM_11990 [Isosphaerales bacterium]